MSILTGVKPGKLNRDLIKLPSNPNFNTWLPLIQVKLSVTV